MQYVVAHQCACCAGGQSPTPQSQQHRSLQREASPARTPTGPSLGRESGRRLRLAQERMAAAVQAAEAERSETYSGRSTEDTEVCTEHTGYLIISKEVRKETCHQSCSDMYDLG